MMTHTELRSLPGHIEELSRDEGAPRWYFQAAAKP